MSFEIRLVDPDQITLITVEDGYVAIRGLARDPECGGVADDFSSAMFYGRPGMPGLLVAMAQAFAELDRQNAQKLLSDDLRWIFE